jgi:hypothetical protein
MITINGIGVDTNELRFVVVKAGLALAEHLGRQLTPAEVDMLILEAVQRLDKRRPPTATLN